MHPDAPSFPELLNNTVAAGKMRNGWSRYQRTYIISGLSTVVPFYLAVLAPSSNAQNTAEKMSGTSTSSLSITNFFTTATSLVTASSSLFSLNSTSTFDSRPTLPPGHAPDVNYDTDTDSDDDAEDHVFNYYFLFLVLFGVLLAGVLWWLWRRLKRRKVRTQLAGQNALARDLEGWTSPRRFLHGRYGRNNNAAIARREEGLNERGEAPPPYQPKAEGTATLHALDEEEEDSSGSVTVPLRTLPRQEAERTHPPAYHNSSQPDQDERTRPTPS